MNKTNLTSLQKTIYMSLFTGLFIVGGAISIPLPISPVPVTLTDFFVMIAAITLGTTSVTPILLYLFFGIIGLPVFSNGGSGLFFLLGPTGGFLIGFLPLAYISGLSVDKVESTVKSLFYLVIGNLVLYGFGVTWMMLRLGLSIYAATSIGFLPFMPGTVLKLIVVLLVQKKVVKKWQEKFR